MKRVDRIRNLFKRLILIGLLILLQQCASNERLVSEDEDRVIIRNGQEVEFVLIKDGFRFGFRKTDGTSLVPVHPVSGLLAGDPENLSQAEFTKYIGEKEDVHSFEVALENKNKIILRLKLDKETAHFEIENPDDNAIAMALRSGGVSPGYGLGDVLTNQQRLPESKEKFQTEITGFESYDFHSSSGYASRMVSNLPFIQPISLGLSM